MKKQSTLFQGVYEFEDDSGALIAAKIPYSGTADIYDGTAVIVKPNQRAIFIYKGEVGDVLKPGIHKLETENLPILTRLANWRSGARSPLRAEIWFFSGNKHIGKRFGTSKPVLSKFDGVGTIPVRAFGTYNVKLKSPIKFYNSLIGSKNTYDISELEEFVQSQLVELLAKAMDIVKNVQDLSKKQDEVSQELERLAKPIFSKMGVTVFDIQILSLLPSEEILDALESKVAMSLVGDPSKYLLYKTAQGMEDMSAIGGEGDSTNLLLAMMLTRGLPGAQASEAPIVPAIEQASGAKPNKFCISCGAGIKKSFSFCPECGVKQ